MYGDEVYRLFERIKSIFDPDNIFNPGKKVGADPKWAMEHIRKD
jgi:FAD/FMN-containing dehydrogenase